MPVPRPTGPLNTIIVWGKLKRRTIKRSVYERRYL